MSTNYQDVEVEKIIKDGSLTFPQNIAYASAWIMGNLKGLNLKVLDMTAQSSLADFFVLASATNKTHAAAMAEQISVQMKKNGYSVNGFEGRNDAADWILVDLGDVIIHIFLETSRGVYNLDALWGEAPVLEIPQDYYFSEPVGSTSDSTSEKDYF